jgi:hypothetical protein
MTMSLSAPAKGSTALQQILAFAPVGGQPGGSDQAADEALRGRHTAFETRVQGQDPLRRFLQGRRGIVQDGDRGRTPLSQFTDRFDHVGAAAGLGNGDGQQVPGRQGCMVERHQRHGQGGDEPA